MSIVASYTCGQNGEWTNVEAGVKLPRCLPGTCLSVSCQFSHFLLLLLGFILSAVVEQKYCQMMRKVIKTLTINVYVQPVDVPRVPSPLR